MAKTALLPPSAMTSVRRPKSMIAPVGWTQLSGSASLVAAGADGSIWALSSANVGPDRSIWHYVNGGWTNIPGAAMRLAVAPNGALWAVSSSGGIYVYDGANWSTLAGGASDISVGSDGSLYAISSQPGGPYGRGIWHYVNGSWSQLPGAAVHVAASWDTGTYPNSIAPGGAWVVTGQGSIYYYNPASGFVAFPGSAWEIAATKNGGLFALGNVVGSDGNYLIYYNDLSSGSWSVQPGAVISIATNTTSVYAVNAAGSVYTAPVTAPRNVVAATVAFVAPNGDPHVLGTQGAGFSIIGNQPHTFTIAARDASGNLLTGADAPACTLQSGSSAIVVTPVAGSTNAFTVRARAFSASPVTLSIAAGNSSATLSVAMTTVQELWVANAHNSTITGYAGTPPAQITGDTITAGLLGPVGLAFDPAGILWVTNYGNVTAYSGTTQIAADTITAGLNMPSAMAFDPSGLLWVADWPRPGPGTVNAYSGTAQLTANTITNPSGAITGLWGPRGLAFDAGGNLWVANGGGNVNTVTMYTGTTQNTASTISGLAAPFGLAFDSNGYLWIANSYNSTITAYAGTAQLTGSTITAGLNSPSGIAFDASGHLWVANINGNNITSYAGTSQITSNTITAGIDQPLALVFAPIGVAVPTASTLTASPLSLAFPLNNSYGAQIVAISGGTKPYMAAVADPSIAAASLTNSIVTVSPVFNAQTSQYNAGPTTVTVTDAANSHVSIPVGVTTAQLIVESRRRKR